MQTRHTLHCHLKDLDIQDLCVYCHFITLLIIITILEIHGVNLHMIFLFNMVNFTGSFI